MSSPPLMTLIERAIFGDYGDEAARLARALRDLKPPKSPPRPPHAVQVINAAWRDKQAENAALLAENARLREENAHLAGRLERIRGRAHAYAERRLTPIRAENIALRAELEARRS